MNNPNCYICEKIMFTNNDYTFKCRSCNLFISNLNPGYGREIEGIDGLREINSKKIINKILKIKNNINFKILEIGSGKGIFVKVCEDQNIDITASEPDDEQYEDLKKKYKNVTKISLPFKEDRPDLYNKYDFIIFNDVFEHLKNLDVVLLQLKKYLVKDGYLIFSLPSSKGFLYNISYFFYKIGFKSFYNRLWQKDLSSPHITYFNQTNLNLFLKKFKYDLVYSEELDFLERKGIYERINSTYKSKIFCILISILLIIFSFFQKILPRDAFFQIYKNSK